MICISSRHSGASPRAIASHRSRRWASGSSPASALASASVRFWMPCTVLKWYLTQNRSPSAFTHE
jgi:hypothetical protein